MTVRILSEDGIQTLNTDPLRGYQEAQRSGNLAKAVLYLSELKPYDWCPWLCAKLSSARSTLTYEMAACLGCLAYTRFPLSQEKLTEWTVQLIGEEHRPGVADAAARLKVGNSDFSMYVRIVRGSIQLNSNCKWSVPELETAEA